MADRAPDLGELEREAMQLVWTTGETTADAIREQLARKPKESTVRTVLRRLEDKGYITTLSTAGPMFSGRPRRGRRSRPAP
jgi:BlaI family transcriptional regulator, penicillinase repressor